MKTEEKKRTEEVLTEKSTWLRICFLFFRLRPLTLAQIYQMGKHCNEIDCEGVSLHKRINIVATMFAKYENIPFMQDVFLVCLFRTRFMRFLFKHYLIHRLTMAHFKKMVDYITKSYDANFFLTSIIFLKQMNMISEPNPTTALGQSSEE